MYHHIAADCRRRGPLALGLAALLLLGGCITLPQPPARPVQYDFGPGLLTPALADPRPPLSPLSPVVLAEVQGANYADASTAVLYRLAYADARQLRPYQLARWSQPPAQLVEQTLRTALGQSRAVLRATDARAAAPGSAGVRPAIVRVQLEEFSHVFSSASQSVGLIRLRATVVVPSPTGDQLLGQRLFTVQQPAAQADAAAGTQALAEAALQASQQVADWLQALQR